MQLGLQFHERFYTLLTGDGKDGAKGTIGIASTPYTFAMTDSRVPQSPAARDAPCKIAKPT